MAKKVKLKKKHLIKVFIVLAVFGAIFFIAGQLGSQEKPAQPTPELSITGRTIGGFSVSNQPICKQNGKPSIYFFGTSWCPHCRWLHPLFEDVINNFDDQIDVHDWDSIDRTRPNPTDQAVYEKFNPRGSVPTMVFGCRYFRIGTYHEREDDKQAEKDEMTAVICKLIEKADGPCADVSDLINQI